MKGRASFSGLVLLAAMLGCQTITELPSTPDASPTPGAVTPIQIPITHLPTPTPAPAPTPTPPSSGPTPTPRPSSTPPPTDSIHVLCSPAIPPDGFPCPRNPNPVHWGAVEAAILKLVRDQPSLFNGYSVLNEVAYYNGVFRNLYDAGYCAVPDSEEVAVSTRADRKYRENYQILTSQKKYRTGPNSHISACQVP